MYPNPSNFVAGAPGSAWWRVYGAGQTLLCETQGNTFVYALQTLLREKLSGTFTGSGGRTQRGTDIVIDGIPGIQTLAASVAYAAEQRGPSSVTGAIGYELERLQTASKGTPISIECQRALIWVLGADPSLRFENIDVGANPVTLRWKQKSDSDVQNFPKICCHPENRSCGANEWDSMRVSQGAGPTPDNTQPPSTTEGGANLPPGGTTNTPQTAGWTTGEKLAVALGAAVVIGGVTIAVATSKPAPRRYYRRLPSPRSRSIVVF